MLPVGELTHGTRGLRDDLAAMIGIEDEQALLGFVRLLALKKRQVNKLRYPCGTGLRLGRCHNRKLNMLRHKLRRRWFASLLHGAPLPIVKHPATIFAIPNLREIRPAVFGQ